MSAIPLRRIIPLLSAVAVALFFVAGWRTYRESRRQLDIVARETEVCRDLASSIEHLRQDSDQVEPLDVPEDQMYERVHQAAESAGFDDRSIVHSIHPQPARLTRGGAYQEKDVDLSLQGLTMEQFIRFLHGLCTADPKLRISAITLHEPKGSDTSTLWNVDPLTLTYRTKPPTGSGADKASHL